MCKQKHWIDQIYSSHWRATCQHNTSKNRGNATIWVWGYGQRSNGTYATTRLKLLSHLSKINFEIVKIVNQHAAAAAFSCSSVLFSAPGREQNGQSHCSEMWDRTENGTDKFMLWLFLKPFLIFYERCDFLVVFLSTFTLAELWSDIDVDLNSCSRLQLLVTRRYTSCLCVFDVRMQMNVIFSLNQKSWKQSNRCITLCSATFLRLKDRSVHWLTFCPTLY